MLAPTLRMIASSAASALPWCAGLAVLASPTCLSCELNGSGWVALAAQPGSRCDWRLMGVSKEPAWFTAEHWGGELTSRLGILADPPYPT